MLILSLSSLRSYQPAQTYTQAIPIKCKKKKTVLMNESENITKQEYSNTFLQVTIIVHIS